MSANSNRNWKVGKWHKTQNQKMAKLWKIVFFGRG